MIRATGNRPTSIALATAVAMTLANPVAAEDSIKMGALATLEGAFAALGEDSMRGVKMALEEFDYEINGKKIELITGSSGASPDSAMMPNGRSSAASGLN